ncbi:MAG TPA: AI-2E family transporter [Microbacteriaceae bacterium]|nr:AI-2E family transporter [Microbacteriaceae bacterium]
MKEMHTHDKSHMDAATRIMFEDALAAGEELPAADVTQRQRFLVFNSPFKLGFMLTLGGLAAILFGEALGVLSSIIVYVVAAVFVSLGLDPVVRKLESKGIKRPVGIAIVFASFLLIITTILSIIIPMVVNQIAIFVRTAPQYFTNINEQEWFKFLSERFGSFIDFPGLLNTGRDFVTQPDNWAQVAGGVVQAGVSVANGLTAGLIILILSLYFLASLQTTKRGLYLMVPRTSRAQVIDITEQVTQSIGGYVNGMVLLALTNSVLGFIAMSIFGVPFAGLVAVAVFFLALIPLIGSVLATVLVTIVALFNSPITALSIGIYYLIYMQIESYLFTPRIMNRVVSVPGSLVVIGALAGGTLLGLLGALIAIPVTAMLLMIIKQVWIPKQQER